MKKKSQEPKLFIGFYLLAIVIVACFLPLCKEKQDLAGKVLAMTGIVEISGATTGARRTLAYDLLNSDQARYQPGEMLETAENSNADLGFRTGVFIRILSSSKIQFSGTKIFGGDSPDNLVLDLNRGAVGLKATKLPAKAIIALRTPTAVASVRGTEYLVEFKDGVTTVLVQEGAVAVGPPDIEPTQVVAAGQKAVVAADLQVQLTVQTPAERDRVKRFLAALGDPARKKIDENAELGTPEAIRAHYGELHLVTMKDGRVYTGFVAQHGDLVKVHTSYGVIEIPEAEIQTITDAR